jgi:hypothetical protein
LKESIRWLRVVFLNFLCRLHGKGCSHLQNIISLSSQEFGAGKVSVVFVQSLLEMRVFRQVSRVPACIASLNLALRGGAEAISATQQCTSVPHTQQDLVSRVERSLYSLIYSRTKIPNQRFLTSSVSELERCVADISEAARQAGSSAAGKKQEETAGSVAARILAIEQLEELDALVQQSLAALVASAHREGGGLAGAEQEAQAAMMALAVKGVLLKDVRVVDRALHVAGRAYKSGLMSDRMWCDTFLVLAVNQSAPELVDKWLDLYLKDHKAALEVRTKKVPFQMILNGLTLCADERDVERALRWYGLSRRYAVDYSLSWTRIIRSPSASLSSESQPSEQQVRQQVCELALCARVIRTASFGAFDGGVLQQFVQHVRENVSLDALCRADWPVLRDLMSGLSSSSAMSLVELISKRLAEEGEQEEGNERGNSDSSSPSSSSSSSSSSAPLNLWMSLLSNSARSKHVAEAEALFAAIRGQFELSLDERSRAVGIMMNMYASLSPPDFNTLCCFFFEQVVNTPSGEARIVPSEQHYRFLLRAADSPNAAAMIYDEMLAMGIPPTVETFEALLRTANPTAGPIKALSKMLPGDYEASPLDAQLKVPADRDAHLRREEALLSRNRPVIDSTGMN